jgi:hypothetical protein
MMKRKLIIGILSVSAFIICSLFVVGFLFIRPFFVDEELSSKVEWSVVQSVEWQHRDKPGDKIEIVRMEEYSLVGIPIKDAKRKVWIMLNAKNPPYYKQIPAGNYTLSENEFKTIMASNIVSSTVANCLKSHVEER